MAFLVEYNPIWDLDYELRPKRLHRPRYQPYRYREPSLSRLMDLALSPLSELDQLDRLVKEEEKKLEKVSPFGKNGFQVSMDVKQFQPNELNVKVVDNHIVVEGKHEEREDDHGYISRHFVRRYALPKDYDPEKVCSTLSSDGVLTVSVPKPQAIEDKSKERVIQIQQTGPAHLNVKENPKDDGQKVSVCKTPSKKKK